jgi:predicted O-methyltransferase YrrM
MLQLVRSLITRRRQFQRELATLQALPPTPLNETHLRWITVAEIAAAFLPSGAIAAEWPEVAAEIDQIVRIRDMMTAGVNPGDRRAIYHLIRALRPRRVLEIGTNVGASTLHIAAAMKRNNEDSEGEYEIVTVDIADVNDDPDAYWKRGGLPRSPRDNVYQLGMADNVQFVVMNSLSYFDQCASQFDFIFLDGDHAAAVLYEELPRALNHLRAGSTVLLHDFFPHHRPLWRDVAPIPGPALALERFQREGAMVRVIPLGSLPWPTKLGSNVTSLALLTR